MMHERDIVWFPSFSGKNRNVDGLSSEPVEESGLITEIKDLQFGSYRLTLMLQFSLILYMW